MYKCSIFGNCHLLEDIFKLLFGLVLSKYLDDKTFKWTQFLSCLIAEEISCLFLWHGPFLDCVSFLYGNRNRILKNAILVLLIFTAETTVSAVCTKRTF